MGGTKSTLLYFCMFVQFVIPSFITFPIFIPEFLSSFIIFSKALNEGKREEELCKNDDERIKMLETGGVKEEQLLVQKNPFKKEKCNENFCPLCKTYEGKEGGTEKFEGETGEQRRDEEERQEPILKKGKYDNFFLFI